MLMPGIDGGGLLKVTGGHEKRVISRKRHERRSY